MIASSRHPRRGCARALAVAWLALAAASPVLAQRSPGPGGRAWESEVGRAAGLLARTDVSASIDLLRAMLVSEPAGHTPCTAALTSIARSPTAPDALLPDLAAVTNRAADADLPLALAAISSVRTREAARLLLTFTSAPYPRGVQDAAYSALARLAATNEPGSDRSAWAAWLSEADRLDEAGWARRVGANLAAQADRAGADRGAAVAALTDALRRLHVVTPVAERATLLCGMLDSDLDEVRRLGFELVSRELAGAGQIDRAVSDRAMELLRDPRAQIRESAAVLVNQVGPEGAEQAVLGALASEVNPRAAAAMLQSGQRWPSEALCRLALAWLSALDRAAAAAAADGVWAGFRAGVLNDPADRERVVAALRATDGARLSPAGCRLLAALGNEDDRLALAHLLGERDASIRLAVGESLVSESEFLDDLLLAARNDVQLYGLAVRGVILHWPRADGYRAVADLKAPTDDDRRRCSLLMVATALTAQDLLEIASAESDTSMRASLLINLTASERLLSERADPVQLEAIAQGALLLAESRLSADSPDGAIAALDLHDSITSPPSARGASLRVTALLCLDRVADAAAFDAPISAWFAALERCANPSFVEDIARALRTKFAGQISADEEARLSAIEAAAAETRERAARSK